MGQFTKVVDFGAFVEKLSQESRVYTFLNSTISELRKLLRRCQRDDGSDG